jgi:hypothetical protein
MIKAISAMGMITFWWILDDQQLKVEQHFGQSS